MRIAGVVLDLISRSADKLSRLPPVRLKPDLPKPATTPIVAEVEMVDKSPVAPPELPAIEVPVELPPVEQSVPSEPLVTEAVETVVESSPAPEHADVSLSKDTPPPLPPRPTTPTPKPAEAPTPVAGDVLLPFIIFAVVKTNPTQLISHLLYAQRFRWRDGIRGEEGYCLVTLMAVVEYLEHVDMVGLGLGDSERVLRSVNGFSAGDSLQTSS